MRLVCPNCGAQYEVPDEVVPRDGRDVQCSNCGQTWFQPHPDDDRALAEDLGQPQPDEEWSPPAPAPDDEPEPPLAAEEDDPEDWDEGDWDEDEDDETEDAPRPAAAPTPVWDDDVEEDYDEDEDHDLDAPPAAALQPRRRGLDPEVADVLREEAQQEARIRAAETSPPLESQPDLGLGEPEELDERERRAREARDRMARMRGEPAIAETTAVAAATAAGNSRRDLLPDIDEINSTLRSTSERRAGPVEEAERENDPEVASQGGFRRGFVLTMLLFVIAAALYLYAPRLAEAVPAAAPALEAYVGFVDGLRAVLRDWVGAALLWLDGMAGG